MLAKFLLEDVESVVFTSYQATPEKGEEDGSARLLEIMVS